MGNLDVTSCADDAARQAFMQSVLGDLAELEALHDGGKLERGVWRMGAEQELFLVDGVMRPRSVALEVLAEARDPRLTPELGLFNLEANLTPRRLGGRCLDELHLEIDEVLGLVREAARRHRADLLLTGILPTLEADDLGWEHMTPLPRYFELNRTTLEHLAGGIDVRIQGVDELDVREGSVLLEACNTSFQLHLQVDPSELVTAYNVAQAISAPLLAAAVGSPVLLGRRLWSETRIPLFERAVDGRSRLDRDRGVPARVGFGTDWLRGSPVDHLRTQLATFRPTLVGRPEATERSEDPGAPRLSALGLHIGSVYPWNRLCYGVTGGVPHLRIENRVLPSGPSVLDEVANAAFFYGMTAGLVEAMPDLTERLPFLDAKANFYRAARDGLECQLRWIDGRCHPAARLVLDELLPIARRGLATLGVDDHDADRYLGVVEARVATGRTAARWMMDSLAELGGHPSPATLTTVAIAQFEGQETGRPVAEWPLARPRPLLGEDRVRRCLPPPGPLVKPEDPLELASCLMERHRLSHLAVEDDRAQLVGLVRRTGRRAARDRTGRVVLVREAMHASPPTIDVHAPLHEAARLLRAHRKLGAVVAVGGPGRCVGVLTPSVLAAVQDARQPVLDRDARVHAPRDRGLRGGRVAEERESGA